MTVQILPALECPVDFFALGDSCYHLAKQELATWPEAQAKCAERGGYLVEMESPNEVVKMTYFLSEEHPNCNQWIDSPGKSHYHHPSYGHFTDRSTPPM